jgi:hypothetical protein
MTPAGFARAFAGPIVSVELEKPQRERYSEHEVFMSGAKETDQPNHRSLTAADVALLLRHHEQIGSGHPAFYTEVGFVSSTMGGGTITLGGMFQLWMRGLWVISCSRCGGRLHLISLGGSLLSGVNQAYGVCLDCEACLTEPLPTQFSDFYMWGMAASRDQAIPTTINSEPRHGFDWGTGLTTAPVGFINTQLPEFTPMPVGTLLAELRTQEATLLEAESSREADSRPDNGL